MKPRDEFSVNLPCPLFEGAVAVLDAAGFLTTVSLNCNEHFHYTFWGGGLWSDGPLVGRYKGDWDRALPDAEATERLFKWFEGAGEL